jgi:pimeloyl-ACP methyl ester carboxylesterase
MIVLAQILDFLIRNQSAAWLVLSGLGVYLIYRFLWPPMRDWAARVLLDLMRDRMRGGAGPDFLNLVPHRATRAHLEQLLKSAPPHFPADQSADLPPPPLPPWRNWRVMIGLGLGELVIIGGIVAAVTNIKVVRPTVGLAPPRQLCAPRQNATSALVLIHGWTGDADASWTPFSKFACDDPRLTTFDVYGVNYPTFIFRRNLTVNGLAIWLYQDFFHANLFPKYRNVDIIAHSMGGLVARSIYVTAALNQTAPKIRSIIAIGSPFQGADLAALARGLGISRELVADMSPGSSYLDELGGQWGIMATHPRSYCISSPQDAIVAERSAKYQCDCSFDYPQWGHIELVKPHDRDDDRYRTPIRALLRFEDGAPTAHAQTCF